MTSVRPAIIATVLLAAALSATAEGPPALVFELRGTLNSTQISRIEAEIRNSADRGTRLIILDFDLDDASLSAGARLAEVIASHGDRPPLTALVSGNAPGGALLPLFACKTVWVTSDGVLGPVPRNHQSAVLESLTERGLPQPAYRALLWPDPGEDGTLGAEAAVRARIAGGVVENRAAVLALHSVSPEGAETRSLGGADFGGVEGRRRTVKGPFSSGAVIPIEGVIDDTQVASVKRRVAKAIEADAKVLVFEVDSPGGTVSASMELSDFIATLDTPTVMLILKKAISGAALASMAGDEIIMGRNGEIGDCQPISVRPGGYDVLGEKFQSPLRARFRKYAERNGYPVALAEAMVTEQMAVDRITFADGTVLYVADEDLAPLEKEHGEVVERKNIVKDNELLTMTAKDTYEYGFAGPPVPGSEEAFEYLGLSTMSAPRLEESWAEKTSRFLLSVKGLLFLIGIVAIYMEFKAPGFGVPGAIGILAFALFFSASLIADISSELSVVLFLLGLALIAVEIFIVPGFGLPGIAGATLVLVSLYMASVKYGLPSPSRPWEMAGAARWGVEFGGAVLLSFLIMFIIARYLPGTAIGRRIILAPEGEPGALGLTGSASLTSQAATALAGRHALAITDLRPAGRIEVGNEPFDAVTDGDYIEKGTEVEVLETRGNRIVVRKA